MDVCNGQLESPRVLVAAPVVSHWTCVLKSHVKIEVAPCFPSFSGTFLPPRRSRIREYFIRSRQDCYPNKPLGDISLLFEPTRRLSVFQINFYLHEFVQCGECSFLQRTSSRHMIIIYTINNKINDEPSLFLKNKCYRGPFTTRTLKC